MNEHHIFIGIGAYWLVLSLAAVLLTVTDKVRAAKLRWRIAESTLLIVALFGGAEAEYITMRCIRHKTLHKKFMIGLPWIIVLHLAIIGVAVYFRYFY